ncbi:MAG: hypothetical protein HZA02_05260 [Nitrospinae bacterium]|nr:hypothetical protein [Nitrospinota bacterium]
MAKKERRPAKDKPKNATSDSPPKPPQEKDYVFPPIGSAVVPQSGQAAADLGRLEKQKCLSWTNCLELMFGKSEEPQEHLNRLAPWKHKHYGNFLTPSKRPPSDDTRIKFVEIKKELLHQEPVSFPGGQARLLFLPGGVYEAPADFADGMLLEHGYGIETTRPLSTESELEKLLQSVLDAVEAQREFKGKVFRGRQARRDCNFREDRPGRGDRPLEHGSAKFLSLGQGELGRNFPHAAFPRRPT